MWVTTTVRSAGARRWWSTVLVVGLSVIAAGAASAQTTVPSPIPSSTRLVWDHDGVNVSSWKLTIDGTDQVVTPSASPADGAQAWSIPFPALTPGAHTLIVCAVNVAGSGCSDPPFSVKVVVVPSKPTALRIATP